MGSSACDLDFPSFDGNRQIVLLSSSREHYIINQIVYGLPDTTAALATLTTTFEAKHYFNIRYARYMRCFRNYRETRRPTGIIRGGPYTPRRQDQLKQTLIVCLLKTHLFSLIKK